ncbi:uncharacterized protein LOC135945837 [Cloeon dipterum]|uniref:uncharacterized protein LOC135945837 n=1 Tax=Cloeon dipterum TaxID=197152 RepID=UPI0032204BFD
MEYEQLGCLKLAGLSDAKNNLKWSSDDKIAVVTRKGVHVVTPSKTCSGAKELQLLSSLVEVKNEYPTHYTGLDADELFQTTDEKWDVYEMMLDPLLFRGVKQTENQPPYPLQAEWSPNRIPGLESCVLAVRSSSGGVYVHCSKMQNWLELCDITEVRRAVVSQNWTQSELSFQLLKSRINQLLATALCWAEMENSEEPFLWIAYADGSVVMWKIDSVGAEMQHCIELKCISRISHLSFWKERLIVGENNGKVYLVNTSSGNISELWPHEDDIAVDSSLSVSIQPEGCCFVVVVKGSCLVAAAVNEDGDAKQIGAKNFGSLGVSGLIHIKDNKFLISHLCGSIEMVTLMPSKSSIEFISHPLNHKLNSSYVNTHGIAVSRNRIIYAVTQSVFALHDHLLLRDPTTLTFFTFSSAERVWPLLGSLESVEKLQFSRIWDIFEIIRLTGGVAYWQDKERIELVEKIPVLHRKLLAVSLETAVMQEQEDEVARLKRALDKLDKSILAHSFLKRVTHVPEEPTLAELVSLQLMTCFLKNLRSGNPWIFTSQEMEIINNLPKIEAVEKCTICADDVITPELMEMKCVRGHTLPRCCLTMTQCCETPYRICQTCHQCCLLNPYFDAEPRCVFCNEMMEEETF